MLAVDPGCRLHLVLEEYVLLTEHTFSLWIFRKPLYVSRKCVLSPVFILIAEERGHPPQTGVTCWLFALVATF